MEWWPATEAQGQRYIFTLTHSRAQAIGSFTLCISGHGKIDPTVPVENAVLRRVISNFAEIAPPAGFVLPPGQAWRFVVRGTNLPFQHWNEAATAAYILPSDGAPIPVSVGLCTLGGAPADAPRWGPVYSDGHLSDGLALIPWPRAVEVHGSVPAPLGLHATGTAACAIAAIASFTEIHTLLFDHETLLHSDGMPAHLVLASLPAEAYRLRFDAGAATIEAGAEAGFVYGLITLGQVLRAAQRDPARCRFPASGLIADAPHFAWRGTHLDVSRQFYPIAELEKLLAILAWNKFNRFHLHLTDDEAWRLDIPAYPDLTQRGAYRGHDLPLPPLLGSGPACEGGSYSADELRALVAQAERFNVVIVPEVDLPGHCFAAIAALPWLRDPDEHGEYRSVQGFPNNCLNPALQATTEFVETMVAELLAIFPARWIHIGADEVPAQAWATSPLARAEGGTATLQGQFLRQLQARLRTAGRISTAWDEAAQAGLAPQDAVLVAWQDAATGRRLAGGGYNVVMAPAQAYYLNMALGPEWWEPGASWAGWSSTEATYQFDPAAGFAPADLAKLIGVQCCIWSEQMRDRRVFQRLVFPRLSAVAETAWSDPATKSWSRFAAAAPFMPTL